MKRVLGLWVLVTLAAPSAPHANKPKSTTAAQDPKTAPAAPPAADAAKPDAAPALLRTVVLGLEARRQVDPALANALTDIVQSEYLVDKSRTVFGRAELARLVQFEGERAAMGCSDDGCFQEIADALDAERLVFGTMDRIGSTYLIVLSEIIPREARPVARAQRRLPADNEDVLIAGVQGMAREMLIAQGTTLAPAPRSTSAPSSLDAAAEPGAPLPRPQMVVDLGDADGGALVVHTNPEGLVVRINDKQVGQSPLVVTGLTAGDAVVGVTTRDGTVFRQAIKVWSREETVVNATMPDSRRVRTKPEVDSYDAETWRHYRGIGLNCGGCVGLHLIGGTLMGCGTLIFAAFVQPLEIDGAGFGAVTAIAGSCCSLGGLGLGIYGGSQLFSAPVAPWEQATFNVAPPAGRGEPVAITVAEVVVPSLVDSAVSEIAMAH